MKLKNYAILLFCILMFCTLEGWSQSNRVQQLKTQLESLVVDAPGLTEKTNFNTSNVTLSSFLQAVANAHKVNMSIDPSLDQFSINNNFSGATVLDILVFVCKEYNLTIDFTGNILSIRKYEKPIVAKKQRQIPITYVNDLLSIDLQRDTLYAAFKQIIDKTGKNLVFAPGMEQIQLTGYIQNMPFDSALDKIAFTNNMLVTKTRDNYYLFERNDAFEITSNEQKLTNNSKQSQRRPQRKRRSNFFFEKTKSIPQTLNVDFENTPISNIINDIGHELKINMFTASPLTEAGNATAKADNISFDLLLNKILENTDFTYKKQDSIYYFGKKDQISLRDAVVIPLMHRSIEVMNTSGSSGRRAGRTSSVGSGFNNFNNGGFNNNRSTNRNFNTTNNGINQNTNRQSVNTNRGSSYSQTSSTTESLINTIPKDITQDLEIKIDVELNSFIVSGPNQNIERFKNFIHYIDKPVPVILIEVMLLEINKSATVETGVEWGIGESPTTTQGGIYPNTDITLGANSVNRIIGNFNGFGSWNLGKVVPNFFAKIKAMETNGDVKIRSAPRLSALNGHRANLSIGETTYYAVTQRDIIGSQNPQTSTITNYQPIDAEFAINIKPLVSGDGQITLDINVIQSTFNGNQIADDAPPGVNSREFNSIIRVKDQDLVILGGLEEKIKNDSGSGVPFLARVPIIKWFFSKKKREDTKKKLTVLIKPTIIK